MADILEKNEIFHHYLKSLNNLGVAQNWASFNCQTKLAELQKVCGF
jgi:hypothetical protein